MIELPKEIARLRPDIIPVSLVGFVWNGMLYQFIEWMN